MEWWVKLLFKAVKNCSFVDLDMLIDSGYSLNVKDNNGSTLLHEAVKYDRYSMIKTLLQKGVNKDIPDSCGKLAIEYAASKHIKNLLQLDFNGYNCGFSISELEIALTFLKKEDAIEYLEKRGIERELSASKENCTEILNKTKHWR